MMGIAHGTSGVLAVTIAGAYLNMDLTALIVLGAVVPGSALLPDIDHVKSTVSRTYGPVSRGFSKLVGHRQITHSVPGVTVLGGLLYGAVLLREGTPVPGPWYVGTALYVLSQTVLCSVLILVLAAFVRLFRNVPGKIGSWFRRSWFDDLAPFPIVLGIVVFSDLDLRWVPIAVVAGCLIHMLGDMITKMGLRLLWPFSKKTFRLARIKAGGKIETRLIMPVMIAGIVWCVGVMTWPGIEAFGQAVIAWW